MQSRRMLLLCLLSGLLLPGRNVCAVWSLDFVVYTAALRDVLCPSCCEYLRLLRGRIPVVIYTSRICDR